MSTEITDELINEFIESKPSVRPETFIKEWEQFKASKQPKPDWEILSYRVKGFVPREGGNVIIDKNSLNWVPAQEGHEYYEIFSVKRLSDGDVFTLSTPISTPKHKNLTLTNFLFHNNILYALTRPTDEKWRISEIENVKKSLFTTEDGQPIYKGDKVALLSTDNWLISYSVTVTHSPFKGDKNQFKYFSTKEVAEDYVLWNKETLSLNEIKELGDIFNHRSNIYFQKLIQRAEEKLNTTHPINK